MNKLDRRDIDDILALTPMQEGMLYHYLKDPGSSLYLEQLSLDIAGEIDETCFEQAWNFVVETNEMLRTVFRWENVKKPTQVILNYYHLKPVYYNFLPDTAKGEDNQVDARIKEIETRDRDKKFDLSKVPFRVSLCKINTKKYTMIITNHHILYDGWSSGIILKEFFHTYNSLIHHRTPIRPVKKKFKDFVKLIQSQDISKQEQYWKNYLYSEVMAGQEDFLIKPKKAKPLENAGNYRLGFSRIMKESLDRFIKQNKITLAALLYTAWGILLQKYHSIDDVLFDVTVSGRSAKIPGIEEIVGLFINTLPLRVNSHPHEPVSRLLSRIQHMLQEREEYINSSQLMVKEYLDRCKIPMLFDSVLVLENYPLDLGEGLLQENSPLSILSYSISGRTAYDLTIIITLFEGIDIRFTYDNRLFNEGIVSKLARHFTLLVEEITGYPGKSVFEIGQVLGKEAGQILYGIKSKRRQIQSKAKPVNAKAVPRNKLEEKLVDIWSEVFLFPGSSINIDDDFFEFGGHSLKAVILAGKINERLHIKIPLAEVFRRPTIRELSQFIRESPKDQDGFIPIEPVEKREYYRLSSGQQRMYVFQHMDPQRTDYNGVAVMVLEGSPPVNRDRLTGVFNTLIKRHESLRTSFLMMEGEPMQKVHDEVEFHLEPAAGGSQPVTSTIKNFIRSFDLSRIPLLRAGLVELQHTPTALGSHPRRDTHSSQEGKGYKYLLMVDMHHIVTDGVSMEILVEEMMLLYEGKENELPGLRIQYKDYAQWQNSNKHKETLKKQENYWLKELAGKLSVLNLPTDYPRPSFQCFDGESVEFAIRDNRAAALRKIVRDHDTTLYVILLAVYYVLLAKYTGQEDIIIGTSTAGRTHPQLHRLVGMFINMVPMRNYPTENKPFSDFLKEVRKNVLKAFENQDYPYEELLRKLGLHGDPSRDPLNIAVFVIHNHRYNGKRRMGNITISPYNYDPQKTNFDLNLSAVEQGDTIVVTLQYAVALFKHSTASLMAEHYMEVLEQVLENEHVRLRDIKITFKGSSSKPKALEEGEGDFLF